ncbi:protein of unknown function [Burkholderia multivorans]
MPYAARDTSRRTPCLVILGILNKKTASAKIGVSRELDTSSLSGNIEICHYAVQLR